LPGVTTLKPGSATTPLPGIGAEVVDDAGRQVSEGGGYVTLKGGYETSEEHGQSLRRHCATKIGPIARPKTIVFTDDLPKTRSGKIMRRLLRDVAEGRDLGDTTTLADPSVVEEIRARARTAPTED